MNYEDITGVYLSDEDDNRKKKRVNCYIIDEDYISLKEILEDEFGFNDINPSLLFRLLIKIFLIKLKMENE